MSDTDERTQGEKLRQTKPTLLDAIEGDDFVREPLEPDKDGEWEAIAAEVEEHTKRCVRLAVEEADRDWRLEVESVVGQRANEIEVRVHVRRGRREWKEG